MRLRPVCTLEPEQTKPQSKSASQLDIKFKHRGIHFCNLNIRHLKQKTHDMKLFLNSSKSIDVFGVCETFLNITVDNISIHIDGYKTEKRQNDPNASGKGGGVLFYVADHINYVRRNNLE